MSKNNGLTALQHAWVTAYLETGNATEAARRAGYAGNDNVLGVTGHDNLRNPKISAAIARHFANQSMMADEVAARLTTIARFDAGPFLDANGEIDVLRLIDAGATYAINEIRTKHTLRGDREQTFKFESKLAALTQIAKLLGINPDRLIVQAELDVEFEQVDPLAYRDDIADAPHGPASNSD